MNPYLARLGGTLRGKLYFQFVISHHYCVGIWTLPLTEVGGDKVSTLQGEGGSVVGVRDEEMLSQDQSYPLLCHHWH